MDVLAALITELYTIRYPTQIGRESNIKLLNVI